jgi:hypothetical protein
MKMTGAEEIRLGQVVQLRKLHPCGSDRWVIVRLGADIGLRCLGCGRRVLLPRSMFYKRVKRWLDDAPVGQPPPHEGQ